MTSYWLNNVEQTLPFDLFGAQNRYKQRIMRVMQLKKRMLEPAWNMFTKNKHLKSNSKYSNCHLLFQLPFSLHTWTLMSDFNVSRWTTVLLLGVTDLVLVFLTATTCNEMFALFRRDFFERFECFWISLYVSKILWIFSDSALIYGKQFSTLLFMLVKAYVMFNYLLRSSYMCLNRCFQTILEVADNLFLGAV